MERLVFLTAIFVIVNHGLVGLKCLIIYMLRCRLMMDFFLSTAFTRGDAKAENRAAQ